MGIVATDAAAGPVFPEGPRWFAGTRCGARSDPSWPLPALP